MPKLKKPHRSSRRVPPPKDSDFDHEISLVDHSENEGSAGPSSAASEPPQSRGGHANGDDNNKTTASPADGTIPRAGSSDGDGQGPKVHVEGPTPFLEPNSRFGAGGGSSSQRRPPSTTARPASSSKPKPKTPESAIDILYENQRGGFLCGIPLFSSKALGNLDPPPWTNCAHRASPTDIHTAQVPDPSWEWAWPAWKINEDETLDLDEGGWEYSFAFSRRFSWHRARWWNSFVRRRAWIRKRVKRAGGYDVTQDPHMLNTDYFTVRPSSERSRDRSRSRSPSRTASVRDSRISVISQKAGADDSAVADSVPIGNVDDLVDELRRARIDREKIEAVNNYLENAEDELEGLQTRMHDIMALFVFQASRRVLLTRLTDVFEGTSAQQQRQNSKNKNGKGDRADAAALARRVDNLAAAVRHADEEVKRLEYWSDVKGIVEQGVSKSAVDGSQGWDMGWQGVDDSGPSEPSPPADKR